tara:strand:+ start:68 stop:712 length:645 start_codon:yes stop_codon:yes gene_type:complete
MNEEISIINSNTRREKIRKFFINNKKLLIIFFSLIILLLFSYFAYEEIKSRNNKKLAERYNNITINYDTKNELKIKKELVEIINKKNSTYSVLALYFIIDNGIKSSNEEINEYFDILINDVNFDKEIKNLIIYKKGLFNSDFESENNLIAILNPVINSDSVWKSHALYLIAEYFMDKNQKQKAKEFYNQILNYKKSNDNILVEARKRLNRDFSE